MDRFHIIDDAAAILRSRGVFRQVKLYQRGHGLYAAHGAGFIRLYKGGGTSVPNVSWDDLDLGAMSRATDLPHDPYGRLLVGTMKKIEAAE